MFAQCFNWWRKKETISRIAEIDGYLFVRLDSDGESVYRFTVDGPACECKEGAY